MLSQETGLAITLIMALFALTIAVGSLWQSRRMLILEALSRNRMLWIKDVRMLIAQFIQEYHRKKNKGKWKRNEAKLVNIRDQIALYMRNDREADKAFLDRLSRCIDNEWCHSDYKELIAFSQYILARSWMSTKYEARVKYGKRFTDRITLDCYDLIREYAPDEKIEKMKRWDNN